MVSQSRITTLARQVKLAPIAQWVGVSIALIPTVVGASSHAIASELAQSQSDFATDALFPVLVDNQWGFINRDGEWVVEPQFEDAIGFWGQERAGVMQDGQWGLLDRTGEMIVAPQYDLMGIAANGLVPVQIDGNWGFVDYSGELAIAPTYNFALEFWDNDLAPVEFWSEETGIRMGFINTEGELVIPAKFLDANIFSEGLAPVAVLYDAWGFINTDGELAIMPQFDFAFFFVDGLAPAMMNGRWGYINTDGNWVIQPQYDDAWVFDNGLAPVRQGDFWGYINQAGETIIDFQFDYAFTFSEGLAEVTLNGQQAYIDATGTIIWIGN